MTVAKLKSITARHLGNAILGCCGAIGCYCDLPSIPIQLRLVIVFAISYCLPVHAAEVMLWFPQLWLHSAFH